MSEGWTCAHCGQDGLGMYCHLLGDSFSCEEGKENHERGLQGLTPLWDKGHRINRVCSECGSNVLED